MAARRAELEIQALGAAGDGIARGAAGPIYVPYTLPGERALVELGGRRGEGRAGRSLEILKAAPERVEPPCRHFGICGGCALQHLENAAYLEWKRRLVAAALARRGLQEVEVEPCIATPPASRRRVRLRAILDGGGVRLGLNRRRSHEVVPLEVCPLLRPALAALFAPLRALLPRILPVRSRADVQLTETEGGLDLWIVAAAFLSLAQRQTLTNFAEAHDLARVSWGADEPETVVRRRPATQRFGSVPVEPPPTAFVQASLSAETAIVGLVREAMEGSARVADLFAGAGTLSLPLAWRAMVTAVDADAGALEALVAAARPASELKLLTVQRRDLFRRPLSAPELTGFDAAVFDPPRAGARAQAEMLAVSGIPTLVAVSCDPGSFARDARILVDGGYRLERVTPIDQFLWSPEVELVACFRKHGPRR